MEEPSKLSAKDNLSSYLTDENQGNPSFWKDLCPQLTISDAKVPIKEEKVIHIDAREAERKRRKLISHGYTLVDEFFDPVLVRKIRQGVEQLNWLKLPPTFILLFDETWDLARASQKVFQQCAHPKNHFNFDLLAWFIETGKGGFSPHRDRQPEDASKTFHQDQQSKFITQWIALSDATTENSCLYVIPKPNDPGYNDGDTEKEDPLLRALPDKESYQNIRALPRKSGQSILFTHRIIHWGSKSDLDSQEPPRIAISFVSSDPEFELPLVDPSLFTAVKNPPFRTRLLLVCAQLLIYYQRMKLTKETIKACYAFCKENEHEFNKAYRHKVFIEFVNAMKESTEITISEKPKDQSSENVKLVMTEEGDEEDDDDAMMQEMLDAETGGYGEFQDDYDELGEDEYGEDYDDVEDDSEEEVDLFGKRRPALESTEVSKGKLQKR
jgi:hypothetical protein